MTKNHHDSKVTSAGNDFQPQQKVHHDVIVLFDLDGTLTPPRLPATPDMIELLKKLKEKVYIGIVTGSNECKMKEQLSIAKNLYEVTDYSFSENGALARYHGQKIAEDSSILSYLGEKKLQNILNFCLHYIADLELPVKRGTFIELRTGLLNISPIGRNCSMEERHQFAEYDKVHGIRERFKNELEERYKQYGLHFAIGGQISIDCYPEGWDKRACLCHLEEFKKIYFFGDRTEEGGNDYEIYSDLRVSGNSVSGPEATKKLIEKLFF